MKSIVVKKNILIILHSDLYVRNYLTTNALSLLDKVHELSFLASEALVRRELLEERKGYLGTYSSSKNVAVHELLQQLRGQKYQHKSSSFAYRLERQRPKLNAVMFRRPFGRIPLRVGRYFLMNLFYLAIRFKWLRDLLEKLLTSRLRGNSQLEEKLIAANPDLIVFPSSAVGADANELLEICHRREIKTLFLIDNWDNLSSKSVFAKRPDYLGVWGKQASLDAQHIHGFESENVFQVGTPRFQKNYQLKDKTLPSHFEFPYILFTGTALHFDEEAVLLRLNQIIDKNPDVFGATKIVYRPHPWRQAHTNLAEEFGEHVVIDPQMLGFKGNNRKEFQPDLDYYPSLLKNAAFVVGGPTSMIIEAAIFSKSIVLLAHMEAGNYASPYFVFKKYEHLRGLEMMPLLRTCFSLGQLENIVCAAVQSQNSTRDISTNAHMLEWYVRSSEDYDKNILAAVESVFEKISGSHHART